MKLLEQHRERRVWVLGNATESLMSAQFRTLNPVSDAVRQTPVMPTSGPAEIWEPEAVNFQLPREA